MATNLPQGREQPPDNLACSYTDSSSIPVSNNPYRNTPSAQTSDPDYANAFSIPASDPTHRNTLSMPTSNSDYRDASSLTISESDADNKDTSRHPLSADDPECDGDASSSSGSSYLDAASAKTVTQHPPQELLYIDAVSTGSTPSDTRAWQQSACELCVVYSLQEYKWAGQKLKILIVVKNGSKFKRAVCFIDYNYTGGHVRNWKS